MTDHWFYNDQSGRVIYEGNSLLAEVQAQLPTWHAFPTKAAAEAYKTRHPANLPIIGDVADAAGNAVKDTSVGGFLGALSSANTWLRVAEVALGVVLVVVGLIKLAPPGVVQTVKTAGKAAAIL